MPKRNEEVGDVYSENYNQELEEGDGIDEAEEGFMQGYNEEELAAECANCKKVLSDKFIEDNSGNKNYRFCSRRCVNEFLEED